MSSIAERLNHLLAEAGSPPLRPALAESFATYLTLLQRWNARTNLTAIRDEEGILRRHFVECILCAHALPEGITSLLDLGSGAGFPGLPIALLRPEITVTLAESQHKKSAFLREAVRTLDLPVKVHAARVESLTGRFDCVALRAVDDMAMAITLALPLIRPGGCLALLITLEAKDQIEAAYRSFTWQPPVSLSAGTKRILLLGSSLA